MLVRALETGEAVRRRIWRRSSPPRRHPEVITLSRSNSMYSVSRCTGAHKKLLPISREAQSASSSRIQFHAPGSVEDATDRTAAARKLGKKRPIIKHTREQGLALTPPHPRDYQGNCQAEATNAAKPQRPPVWLVEAITYKASRRILLIGRAPDQLHPRDMLADVYE